MVLIWRTHTNNDIVNKYAHVCYIATLIYHVEYEHFHFSLSKEKNKKKYGALWIISWYFILSPSP